MYGTWLRSKMSVPECSRRMAFSNSPEVVTVRGPFRRSTPCLSPSRISMTSGSECTGRLYEGGTERATAEALYSRHFTQALHAFRLGGLANRKWNQAVIGMRKGKFA